MKDDRQEFLNAFEKIRHCFCVAFLLRHRFQMASCRSTTAGTTVIFFSADSQQQTVTTEAFHQEMLQMAQKKKNPEMHQNFLVALMSSLVAVSFHYIS